MTTPQIPTIQKSWDDQLISSIPTVVNTGWGITKALADPLHKIGNWLWNAGAVVTDPVTARWNECTHKTQTMVKRIGYGVAFAAVGGAAAAMTYPAIASLTASAAAVTATAAATATVTTETVAPGAGAMIADAAVSSLSSGLSMGARFVSEGGINKVVGAGTTIYQLAKGDSTGVALGKGLLAATATGTLASASPFTHAAIAGTARVGYELYHKQDSIKSAGIKGIVAATASGAAAALGGPLVAGAVIGVADTARRLYNGESKTTSLKMGLATGAAATAVGAMAGPGVLAATAAGTALTHSLAQDGTLKDIGTKALTTAALAGVGSVAAGALSSYALTGAAIIAAPVVVPAVVVAVPAVATASVLGSIASGIGTATSAGIALGSAATIGAGAGLATAVHSWVGNKDPLMTALGKGAGVGAAVTAGALAMASSAALGATVVGIGAGSYAAAATAMASNPDHVIHAHFPDGNGSSRLTTPGTNALPDQPEKAIKELTGRVSKFRSTQPAGTFWEDPQIALIKGLSPQVIHEACNALEELGPNPSDPMKAIPSDEQKVATLKMVLQRAGIDPALVDISLVEKMGEVEKITGIRVENKLYVERKLETDRQIDQLVENSAIIGTIYTVHIYMMGYETTDLIDGVTVWEKMQTITQEAKDVIAEGKTPDLWKIYRKHLGKMYDSNGTGGVLGWIKGTWKRFWAKCAYYAVHKWNTATTAMTSFTKNVIGEFRNVIESKNQEKLKAVFEKSFDQLGLLLDIHNETAENYANREIAAATTLTEAQKMSMNLLGDKQALQKDPAAQAELAKKIMRELCTNFANILIEKSLPQIEIVPWKKLTVLWCIPIVGQVALGFAWLFEKWAMKKVKNIADTLPYGIENLVQMGLSQTMPNQYTFKKAIADSLTTQIEYLVEDMDVPSTCTPPRLEENSYVQGTAQRLIKALKIRSLGQNPRKEDILELLQKMKTEPASSTEKLLEDLTIKGAQIFMYYFSKKPEKMEKLFGDMLGLTNMMFKPYQEGDEIPTEALYNDSHTRLKNATGELITKAIQGAVEGEIKGPATQTMLDQYVQGRTDSEGVLLEKGLYTIQKDQGTRSFTSLSGICTTMSATLERSNPDEGDELLKQIDQYAETLGRFGDQAKAMDIDLYVEPVRDAFYQTFHTIYEDAVPLATQATELQRPAIQYVKDMKLGEKLLEFANESNKPPSVLKKRLDTIEEAANSHNGKMPELTALVQTLREHVSGIEVAIEEEEKERKLIENMAKLVGKSGSIPASFLANPKANDREIERWTRRIRAGVPTDDQEPLFSHIKGLYAAAAATPQQDLSPYKIAIETELAGILEKHTAKKAQYTAARTSSTLAMRELTLEMNTTVTDSKDAGLRSIKAQLAILERNTGRVLKKLNECKPSTVIVPLSNLAPNAMKELQTLIGAPIEKRIDPYLDLAFGLITDHNVYQGTSRLLMKSVVAGNQKD